MKIFGTTENFAKKRRFIIAVLMVAAIVCLLFAAVPTKAFSALSGHTIRVGYNQYPGMIAKDEEGNFSGYTYEYLMEIAQYTGWNYEFVEYDDVNMKMMNDLKNGVIDLVGNLKYSSSMLQYGKYASTNYGTGYRVLCAAADNAELETDAFFRFDEENPLIVAVELETTDEIQTKIIETCISYGLKNEASLRFVFEDRAVIRQSVFLDKDDPLYADVFNDVDLNFPKDVRVIASYDPFPFYFLLHDRADSNYISQISNAIRSIREVDVHFEVDLRSKYFDYSENEFTLTQAEKNYIATLGALKVGISPDKAPVQFIDSKGDVKGIGVDILNRIAEIAGIRFEYVKADSQEDLLRMLTDKEVDMTSGLPYQYSVAEDLNVVFSRPYMVSPMALAINKNVDQQTLQGKKLAIPKGLNYEPTGEEGEIVLYDEVDQCLKAVNSGECDYAYANANVMQYYLNKKRYKNIVSVTQNDQFQKISIALSKPANQTLLSVLNKAIATISDLELQAIVMSNMGDYSTTYSFYMFLEENAVIVIVCLCVLFLAIIGGIIVVFTVNINKNRRIATESSRYKELSALTNEYIFEYDYRRDTIMLSRELSQELDFPEEKANFVKELTEENEEFKGEYRLIQGLLSQDEFREDVCIPNFRGENRWFRVVSKTVRDKTGKRLFSIGKFGDIQEEKEEQQNLEERVKRDSLTGLWNPMESKRLISEGIENGKGAMIVMDVDRFKMVNDNYGHVVGDRVLETLARILKKYFPNDVVGRLGGDEFCVYLKDADAAIETRIAAEFNQFQKELASTKIQDFDHFVTVSAGMSFASGDCDFEHLYRSADKAMYEAKARGGRCFVNA